MAACQVATRHRAVREEHKKFKSALMGNAQSSFQKCLIVLRVSDTSNCFPNLSPFVHAITKYNTFPIESEEDIQKMASNKHLDLEVLDLRNNSTRCISLSTPLGISVKFCKPHLISLKVLEIEHGSPAAAKLHEGDFIVGIEGLYLETNDEFFYTMYRNRGKELSFIVYRSCTTRRVSILLGAKEPILGAILGEGALMTVDKTGDVVNIGARSEFVASDFPNEVASESHAAAVQDASSLSKVEHVEVVEKEHVIDTAGTVEQIVHASEDPQQEIHPAPVGEPVLVASSDNHMADLSKEYEEVISAPAEELEGATETVVDSVQGAEVAEVDFDDYPSVGINPEYVESVSETNEHAPVAGESTRNKLIEKYSNEDKRRLLETLTSIAPENDAFDNNGDNV